MVKRQPTTDLAASVRQRLSNVARERGQELQLILTRYGVERMLYRLSHVPAGDGFVLKGAVLFYLWEGDIPRPTQDVDFLGFGDASPGAVAELFGEVCEVNVESDGLTFLAESVTAAPIRSRQEYGGVRVKLTAMLGKARIPLQVDVGYGDAVTPSAQLATFPTLLDFAAQRVRAYPPETVVAEKLQAIVTLGIANTRMKDFYDILLLSNTHEFDGVTLSAAVRATFDRRATVLPSATPSRSVTRLQVMTRSRRSGAPSSNAAGLPTPSRTFLLQSPVSLLLCCRPHMRVNAANFSSDAGRQRLAGPRFPIQAPCQLLAREGNPTV